MPVFDTLTTWIFDSRKCRGGRVKRAALMPELVDGRLEVSAYGCHKMAPCNIWELNERKDKEPKGRAIYAKQVVDDLDSIYFDPDPPPSLHGNVIGWPKADDERDKTMEIAAAWAEKSRFKKYPD